MRQVHRAQTMTVTTNIFFVKMYSNSHLGFSSLQCVMFLIAELTMHRAQSSNTWQSDSTELEAWGWQDSVRKVSQKSETISDSVGRWFRDLSCESCDFSFPFDSWLMNMSLKAVMLWVMKSTCKPWPQGHEWAMHDVAWTGSRTESCVWKRKDLVNF